MNELYFLINLVLNIITAIVFFNLGKTGHLPKMPKIIKKEDQPKSNFVDSDLEDIRDVDPMRIMDAFKKSLKSQKGQPIQEVKETAKDFEDMIN